MVVRVKLLGRELVSALPLRALRLYSEGECGHSRAVRVKAAARRVPSRASSRREERMDWVMVGPPVRFAASLHRQDHHRQEGGEGEEDDEIDEVGDGRADEGVEA